MHTEPLTNYQSEAMYKELIASGDIDTQLRRLLNEYIKHPEGLTDVQASHLLGVDASTLSARRNDLTKKHGSHVLVNSGLRSNGEGRRQGTIWVLNPHIIRE